MFYVSCFMFHVSCFVFCVNHSGIEQFSVREGVLNCPHITFLVVEEILGFFLLFRFYFFSSSSSQKEPEAAVNFSCASFQTIRKSKTKEYFHLL